MTGPTPINNPLPILGRNAVETIKQLDAALVLVADALRRGQPCYTGKLGLKWALDGGRFKTPYVVSFQYNKVGLPRSRKVGMSHLMLKAKNKSSFRINYHEVRKLLQLAQELLKIRSEITRRLGQFERWECSLSATQKKVATMQAEASVLRLEIENNLVNRMTRAQRQAARFEEIPEGAIALSETYESSLSPEEGDGVPWQDGDAPTDSAYLNSLAPAAAVTLGSVVERPSWGQPNSSPQDRNAQQQDEHENNEYLNSLVPPNAVSLESLANRPVRQTDEGSEE